MKAYEENQRELNRYFELVQNRENWKNSIDAVISPDIDQKKITEAVIYFTGSVPKFQVLESGNIRVTAAGYYATIGA